MDELSEEKVSLPGFLVRQILNKVKETVKEKAGFNIDDINTEKFCKKCFVPAFFCHGKDDTFVRVHHCNDLYMVYPGEKDILIVEGDHNDIRPYELNEKASEFFYHSLKCKYIKEINDYYLGYKLYINDWMNSKFRTPTGDRKDNDISDINDILENKIFSGTIRAKEEPKNNYSKKRYINKNGNNNINYKHNDKIQIKLKNTSALRKKAQNSDNYKKENINTNKPKKINDKNIRFNYSNDNITNVNFNNYKKIQVNSSSLFPKDSFKNKKNNNIIKVNEPKPRLVLKTEFNNNKSVYLKDRIHREIIKVNYPDDSVHNVTIDRIFNQKTSNSASKYPIHNDLIQLNNTITNKKKKVITYIPSQPNFNIRYPVSTIKTVNSNFNYDISPLNNNYEKTSPNNLYYNNYYNITNNNIFINQFQNIYD